MSVRIGKNCALGLEPYSRPWAQFFPIRTSRPANNIYILQMKFVTYIPVRHVNLNLNGKSPTWINSYHKFDSFLEGNLTDSSWSGARALYFTITTLKFIVILVILTVRLTKRKLSSKHFWKIKNVAWFLRISTCKIMIKVLVAQT